MRITWRMQFLAVAVASVLAGPAWADECDIDEDGYIAVGCGGDDCNDASLSMHPIANDLCDGKDNDCDGFIDQHAENQFADLDRDGHGDPGGYLYCASHGQWVSGGACDEGSICVAQANGTGVCIPEKLKDKVKA